MTSEQLQTLIEQARLLAMTAHRGQTRDGGGDYFTEHVEPVALSLPDHLKPIGYLHDVPEDTDVTLQDLIDVGFPKYVTDAVDILTHKNNEPNVSYWTNIAKNKDATEVKIKDIKNNSIKPSERQKEKYAKALALFAKFGYDVA
jgi:(p)ppGpp synthase/HD superfamily hydrolase